MSWVTPKTDWQGTDRCTYADANRIAGNINYLLDSDTLKADYDQDDVITLTERNALMSALETLAEANKYAWEEAPDTSATALNFNRVESITLGIKEWIELINAQSVAKIFSGDAIFLGDGQYLR